ncbi:MAG: hypothetical protein IKP92_05975 [Lachnospiraceae bacterium]|nr:hypothetical protein [Lachnospiraceae bacterium]
MVTNGFIADMSSGFTCNIGQKMPENWSYDQFCEVSDGEYIAQAFANKIAYYKQTEPEEEE